MNRQPGEKLPREDMRCPSLEMVKQRLDGYFSRGISVDSADSQGSNMTSKVILNSSLPCMESGASSALCYNILLLSFQDYNIDEEAALQAALALSLSEN